MNSNGVRRLDVEFPAIDGVTLRGWLYKPESSEAKAPAVVMAHGYAATKDMGLDPFAAALACVGFAVLAYDHRNYGSSDGEPRCEVDPYLQVRDYKDAVTFASNLDFVDPDRVGVWGTSLSGGHVLVVAATDRRVKAVVSIVPGISCLAIVRKMYGLEGLAEARGRWAAERRARMEGAEPSTRPYINLDAEKETSQLRWYRSMSDENLKNWQNKLTVLSDELLAGYEPGAYITMISPTPLLMIAATEDYNDLVIQAYHDALEPKQFVLLKGDHHSPYLEQLDAAVTATVSWFTEQLM